MPETAEPIIIPPRLKPGGTIGLVTPSGPVRDPEKVRTGIDVLEDAGFKVKLPKELRQEDYLAGSDADRARQFIEMWDDPEVEAVMAVRGGYGALRMVSSLNPTRFGENPKILAGFSDITILLNELQRCTGMVTYHTPVVTTLTISDEASRNSFFATLTGYPKSISPSGLAIVTGGTADGRLIGGNLASLCHLIGTPLEPVWQDSILFLEDVGEPLYKIDRMLTQLQVSGRLEKLSGLILGTFSDDESGNKNWDEQVWSLAQRLTGGTIPLWGNFPVGHTARNLSMPVGINAVMNSEEGKLEFMWP